MKKIITCLIVFIFSTLASCLGECTNEDILNFERNCYNSCDSQNQECINGGAAHIDPNNSSALTTYLQGCNSSYESCKSDCDDKTVEFQDNDDCSDTNDTIDCPGGIVQDGVCVENHYGNAGINISTKCLLNGQCSMNIYETMGIRKSNPNPDVTTFAQDVILGATKFFGTVLTILFIVSGLSYVMAGFSGKAPDKAKKMMIGSIVGLLFITLSYTIIRLIQFIATGGS